MVVSTPAIKYEKRNQIAYITLNRPEVMNALNMEIRVGLQEALVDFRDDPETLVAILTGEGGRAFSAGMDLKERASLDAKGQRMATGSRGGGSFIDMEVFKPIIAAIDGFCVAGGLELSLQCDIRIATAKSEFGLPEPRWSLTAGYGLHNLSRMIPLGEALSMQLTGHRISSERAYQIGLIQEVVEDREALFVAAEKYAEEVKLCAPIAIQAIKQIVYQGRNLPVEYSQKLAGPLNARVQSTEDAIEGPRAFSEKRAPVWKMR
ncbi:MAG: enoyl-CoA hydratase/isomerase family protein [Chloroflexi bacterium]|nr:enoyl-CoA hydratase/isomerase family protein [Chloroflexota bacterium]